MANIKISQLTALTPPAAADELPVVDTSASSTKKTTVGEVVGIINGDVDVADDGTATISELPVSKLQDGDARQLLQTAANGDDVEWTSNVDVPGTLDVTGATTLDSTLGVTGQSTLASAAVSDLTSGRVVLAGTSGELEDSAGLTFNGTQLDVGGNVAVAGAVVFEGSTADDFETTLAVNDPTADRTITLPDVSGTVVTTGDTGSVTSTMIADGTIVDADVSPTAEIAVSKLANGTANQVLVTDGTNVSWSDDLTIAGNLTVNGTTTTVNTQTLVVEDKNIELGVVASPTDVTADGGGITLKGTTDKTINWVDATDSWTSSEHVDLASGKSYRINGTEVLSSTTLGSGITESSLTSVGTLGSLTVTGSATAGGFTPTSNTVPTNGLYLPSANSVALSSNGSGRLFIDSSGSIGVGATPVAGTDFEIRNAGAIAKLRINSGTVSATSGTSSIDFVSAFSGSGVSGTARISSNAPAGGQSELAFYTSPTGNSPTERMRISSDGKSNFYRNTATTTSQVISAQSDVGGAASTVFYVRANGGIGNYQANDINLSDRNSKKDIEPASATWGCVKDWEIVNYRYLAQPSTDIRNIGVIAQQVAESCPEVITVFQEAKEATDTEPAQEERLGVKEQQMYWMAIKALQEAMERIETLEAKVAALETP